MYNDLIYNLKVNTIFFFTFYTVSKNKNQVNVRPHQFMCRFSSMYHKKFGVDGRVTFIFLPLQKSTVKILNLGNRSIKFSGI